MNKYTERIYNGVWKENPILIQMLGLCPTLAVTTSATNGAGMGLSLSLIHIYKICQYVYETANAFNSFYHDTKILSEEDEARKDSYIGLITLTKRVLETCIGLLGIEAPERM